MNGKEKRKAAKAARKAEKAAADLERLTVQMLEENKRQLAALTGRRW